jgi:hypothetical protein
MSKHLVALLTFVAIAVASSVAFGQEAATAAGSAGGGGGAGAAGGGSARTQEFNFTDELVQGQLVRPDGESSRVRRRGPGISLIRIREHFVPEMLKSVENL